MCKPRDHWPQSLWVIQVCLPLSNCQPAGMTCLSSQHSRRQRQMDSGKYKYNLGYIARPPPTSVFWWRCSAKYMQWICTSKARLEGQGQPGFIRPCLFFLKALNPIWPHSKLKASTSMETISQAHAPAGHEKHWLHGSRASQGKVLWTPWALPTTRYTQISLVLPTLESSEVSESVSRRLCCLRKVNKRHIKVCLETLEWRSTVTFEI